MKVYTLDTLEQSSQMDTYLKEAYIPAVHRAGIKDVGVFKTIEDRNEGPNIVVVLIPYKSLSQFEELPSLLDQDKEYLTAAKGFIEAPHNDAPYMRLESTLMKAFKAYPNYHVPDYSTPKADRVYELRSYQSATEKLHQRKVEMFDSGESDLFTELGFQPMFFAAVISGSVMPNLVYMTCHANEEAQGKNWDAFKVHPTWQKMKKMEKYKHTVSHIDKWLLYPAEYSDF